MDFDAEALRANILDSQQNHLSWRNFTLRAMRGGVQGCFAFLRGQHVTSFGRQGERGFLELSRKQKSLNDILLTLQTEARFALLSAEG